MGSFLETVRKACLPGPWSQGVKLVRAGAVTVDTRSEKEATLRVRAPEATIAPTVTLFLSDGEWSCDCDAKVDPCAHVAACAIALDQDLAGTMAAAASPAPAPRAPSAASFESPAPVAPPPMATPFVRSAPSSLSRPTAPSAARPVPVAPPPPSTGAIASSSSARVHLAYKLGRRRGTLLFERILVTEGGGERELTGSLASYVLKNRELLATHDDMTLDRVVQGFSRGIVPLVKIAQLLELLESAKDVRLDGQPVRTSGEPLLPRASVRDGKDGGVTLKIEPPRGVSEIVAHGIVRVGSTLRPIGERELAGERLEKLPLVRTFAAHELATVAGEVLPALEGRLDVLVRTTRIPGRATSRVRPRLTFELSQGFHTLSVLPLVVYGDPPAARVDGNTLVHLGGSVPARDVAREKALATELRERLSLVVGRRVDFAGKEALAFAERLRAFGDRVDDPEGLFGRAALAAKVVLTGDDLDVRFETENEDGEAGPVRRADVATVLRAWEDGFDVVPLEGGGFAPLPTGWLSRHGNLLADLLAARRDDGKLSKVAMPALARFAESLDFPIPPGFTALRPLVEGFSSLPRARLPDDLRATLRPYQETGVDWLVFLESAELGGILADDMGLGKTLQTLAALRGSALVVCPTSVLFNWAAEIARFRPSLRVSTYHGPRRVLDRTADVTLTTYGTVRSDLAALSSSQWDAVVLDEAQAIKNPDSQTARAVFALPAKFRLALSGTPVENRLEELFSLSHFANPGLLGGLSDFRARYADPISEGDEVALQKLREKIRPFLLRRKKADVAKDLPPRTDDLLYVELDESERASYDAVRAATRKDLVERIGEGMSVMEALEALLRLRQAACHRGLLPGNHAETSSKGERLVAELSTLAASGNRALVFSQWTSFLDLIEPLLEREGLAFTRLDGSTRDREGVVKAFQDPAGPPVLLLSLKAGGTGLNLTAADHVFLLDPWWNPAVEEQAADRAHRIGQDKPVFVHRLVTKDTVEERILVLQEKKRALAEAAIGEGGAAGGLTREDLMALLA